MATTTTPAPPGKPSGPKLPLFAKFLEGAKRTWTTTARFIKEAPRKSWDSLEGQRAAAIIALVGVFIAFLALIITLLQYLATLHSVVPQPPETAPPANSKCPYNLADGFGKGINARFKRDAVAEQNIDNQIRQLDILTSISPVIDYDPGLATPQYGVNVKLLANDEVIKEKTFNAAFIKSRPAPFDFVEDPVKIDHTKTYKVVVTNTTGIEIVIWGNKDGPTSGYQPAVLDGDEVDWSLSGQVCGH